MATRVSDRYLYAWQYSATAAYILVYYTVRDTNAEEEEKDFLQFEIWDAGAFTRIDKGDVTLEQSVGFAIERLNLYSINEVVYLAHDGLRLKKIWREEDDDGNFSFRIGTQDINIDPVLTEYSDRNRFTVRENENLDGNGKPKTFLKGDLVRVVEEDLTQAEIDNGAEQMFGAGNRWRATGGQMIMLKHPTKMSRTWGLLYNSSTENNSGHMAVQPVPTPKEEDVSQTSYGGRKGESENEDYENPESENLKYDWCSEWLYVYGSTSLESNGKWSGKIVIDLWKPDMPVDEDNNPKEWETLAVIDVNNAMSNKSITRDVNTPGSRIRIRCVRRERAMAVSATFDTSYNMRFSQIDNDTGCYLTLSYAQEIPVYLRLEVIDEGYAWARALHPFDGGWTSSSFAEGAWCGERYGYPRTVGVFQERLVYGGNAKKPCTLWLSKTDDWADFVQGSDSTSPIFGTANTDSIDALQWLQITKSYIMFGSLSGEWYFGGSDGSSVKPSNYSFQRLSNYGSTEGIDAALFGNSTIVAKNGGRQIMDVSYNTLSETGDGANLSLYAEHLFEAEADKIKDLVSTRSPKLMLWVLTDSGKLCSFTYEQNNNVFAWARHEIHDGVLAVASFRRGERDIICMLVKDGNNVVLGELDPNRWLDYDKDSTNPDEKEHIFQDEKADGTFVNYESRIIPTPINIASLGDAYGARVAFKSFDVYLKTHNGEFDGNVWADGTQFTVKLGNDDNAKEYNCTGGWLASNTQKNFGENRIKFLLGSGWNDYAIVDIKTSYPAPLTITAIGAELATNVNTK